MRSYTPLISLAFLWAACEPKAPAVTSPVGVAPTPSVTASQAAVVTTSTPPAPTPSAAPPAPTPSVAPAAPTELGVLAKSNNALAIDLYGKARTQAGNLALSPISLSTA